MKKFWILIVLLPTAVWAETDSVLLGKFPLRPEENPFSVVVPWPPENVPVGSLRLDSELRFEEIFHRLQPPWTVSDTQCTTQGGNTQAGVDKRFQKVSPDSGHRPWTSGFGDQFTLAMQARPSQEVFGRATLAYQTNYADRSWLPINDEHRMANESRKLRVLEGELEYKKNDFSLRGYEGVGHDGWQDRGDLFGLYPAQWEVDKYRNYTGRKIPRGGELALRTPLGKFTFVGGGEQVWGDGPSFYSLYENRLGSMNLSYIGKYEAIPYGDPDEHLQAHSLRAGLQLTPNSRLDLGVLYKPFRVGRSFTRVEAVASGAGIGGSSFLSSQDQTRFKDAWGGQVRFNQKLPVVIDEANIRLQYLGLSAGNKKEFHADAIKNIKTNYRSVFGFTYQAPLEGPVPFVFEGTESNPGASLLTPRGQDDPFRVDWTNREARFYTLVLTYNPSHRTSFYRYTSDLPEMWNLNPDEDAPFSWAMEYQASDYLTATDHMYYVDACGNYVWEPTFGTGARSSAHPLSEVKSIALFNLGKNKAIAVGISGGESPATSSIAYNDTTNKNKPITEYVDAQIRFFRKPFTTWFHYARSNWGPYSDYGDVQSEFQRAFGITVHKLFEAGGEVNLWDGFILGIRYVSVRENDNIFVPDDLGSFDEYRLSLAYRFGVLASFSKQTPSRTPSPPLPRLPEELLSEVRLQVGDPLFDTTGRGARVQYHLKAIHYQSVSRWEIQVFNSTGQVVGLLSGAENPPDEVLWDALDSDGTPLPAGSYSAVGRIWGGEGKVKRSPFPETFLLRYPEAWTQVKEVRVLVPEPYKVEETTAGLKVTFKSSVLFDFGKYVLRDHARKALDQAIPLIKEYPQNNILVEGHTDSIGSKAYNDRLSLARAEAVAKYLISKGVTRERMQFLGRGFSRPATSNATQQGRAVNRRVEITILKAKQ